MNFSFSLRRSQSGVLPPMEVLYGIPIWTHTYGPTKIPYSMEQYSLCPANVYNIVKRNLVKKSEG